MRIVRVVALPLDLPDLAAVAAAEGFGMPEILPREWAAGSQRLGAPGEAPFAARDDAGVLLGIGGITPDRRRGTVLGGGSASAPWPAGRRWRRTAGFSGATTNRQ
ncbi:hypothetical protein GXW74_21895 [Roseomonas eburnea]|uniref:Uncharacterized protein n=1 Tax=Neoroseomonas eburnea TaxID=1346889 RepID=A0A9X9XHH3_9PROT|nr:hypothetical protein [Neoroseomonas eburnea]MBR0683159.1 hypothetical protein [Neoroseomonas eburnea]